MSNTEQVVTVTIMDRPYPVKCPKEEAQQLQESARYLNAEMKKITQSGQANTVERLAVVAALNITHELLAFKNQKNTYVDMMHEQIKSLQRRIQQFIGTKEEALV